MTTIPPLPIHGLNHLAAHDAHGSDQMHTPTSVGEISVDQTADPDASLGGGGGGGSGTAGAAGNSTGPTHSPSESVSDSSVFMLNTTSSNNNPASNSNNTSKPTPVATASSVMLTTTTTLTTTTMMTASTTTAPLLSSRGPSSLTVAGSREVSQSRLHSEPATPSASASFSDLPLIEKKRFIDQCIATIDHDQQAFENERERRLRAWILDEMGIYQNELKHVLTLERKLGRAERRYVRHLGTVLSAAVAPVSSESDTTATTATTISTATNTAKEQLQGVLPCSERITTLLRTTFPTLSSETLALTAPVDPTPALPASSSDSAPPPLSVDPSDPSSTVLIVPDSISSAAPLAPSRRSSVSATQRTASNLFDKLALLLPSTFGALASGTADSVSNGSGGVGSAANGFPSSGSASVAALVASSANGSHTPLHSLTGLAQPTSRRHMSFTSMSAMLAIDEPSCSPSVSVVSPPDSARDSTRDLSRRSSRTVDIRRSLPPQVPSSNGVGSGGGVGGGGGSSTHGNATPLQLSTRFHAQLSSSVHATERLSGRRLTEKYGRSTHRSALPRANSTSIEISFDPSDAGTNASGTGATSANGAPLSTPSVAAGRLKGDFLKPLHIDTKSHSPGIPSADSTVGRSGRSGRSANDPSTDASQDGGAGAGGGAGPGADGGADGAGSSAHTKRSSRRQSSPDFSSRTQRLHTNDHAGADDGQAPPSASVSRRRLARSSVAESADSVAIANANAAQLLSASLAVKELTLKVETLTRQLEEQAAQHKMHEQRVEEEYRTRFEQIRLDLVNELVHHHDAEQTRLEREFSLKTKFFAELIASMQSDLRKREAVVAGQIAELERSRAEAEAKEETARASNGAAEPAGEADEAGDAGEAGAGPGGDAVTTTTADTDAAGAATATTTTTTTASSVPVTPAHAAIKRRVQFADAPTTNGMEADDDVLRLFADAVSDDTELRSLLRLRDHNMEQLHLLLTSMPALRSLATLPAFAKHNISAADIAASAAPPASASASSLSSASPTDAKGPAVNGNNNGVGNSNTTGSSSNAASSSTTPTPTSSESRTLHTDELVLTAGMGVTKIPRKGQPSFVRVKLVYGKKDGVSLEWTSKTKSKDDARLPLRLCTLYPGAQKGMFTRPDMQSRYTSMTAQCLSVVHPRRSLDLVCQTDEAALMLLRVLARYTKS